MSKLFKKVDLDTRKYRFWQLLNLSVCLAAVANKLWFTPDRGATCERHLLCSPLPVSKTPPVL